MALMTLRRASFPVLILLAALVLAGCNLPAGQPTQDFLATFAAQTVAAQLTQIAFTTPVIPTASDTPVPLPPTDTPPPPTPVPSSTFTPGCTDTLVFVSDISIPDNTFLPAGASFAKIWRLRNGGTCTWTTSYAVVFKDGNIMGAAPTAPLAGTIPPGATIDIQIQMTAPTTNGSHQGNWSMRNEKGVLFGGFYVKILVGPTPTATVGVKVAAQLDVPQTFTVDLDDAVVAPEASKRDFQFEAVSAVEKYLTPNNGALFRKVGGAPSLAECQAAALGATKIPLADLPAGSWLCYKTNAGRYGRMEIENITPGPVQTMTIDFVTWGP